MKTRTPFWILCLGGALLGNPTFAEPRNLLFLLVDDLGWADIGCFGSHFYETPNIDRFAETGMRFTQAYAAGSVCSPTRASILTGRHPVRLDITDWIPGQSNQDHNRLLHPEDRYELPLSETTLAEVLKSHDYQTFFAGKWHLGNEGHWPTDQGFETNVGGNSKGSPPGGYYGPWKNPTLKAREKDEYLTERLTGESVRFLETRDPNRPFLLYLSYYNVHTPIQPYRKRIQHFQNKANQQFPESASPLKEHDGQTRPRQDNPALASMIAAVDESVSVMLATLTELGLEDETVVIFFSDNGGLSTKSNAPGPTSNDPLRAGKGWLYEGGIREPTIIRAPGVTAPGSTCSTPMVSMDFFPTFLELAGLPPQPALHRDGLSIVPLLRGHPMPPRTFHWHYPHYHGSGWKPGAAILEEGWKLIRFYHYDKTELYHLDSDLSESNNLALKEPERTAQLLRNLRQWQTEMGAKMPRPNPRFQAR